jgi:dienelactone hydrolase
VFPTAPTKLKIDDALHFERRQPPIDGYEPDTWAWWRHDPAQDKYLLLEEGMATVAQALRDARTRAAEEGDEDGGGIDGVFGFSQGGCLAAMLAAALEEVHKPRAATERVHEGWLKMVREANGGRPLKFAVVVGGFRAGPLELEWLYNPKIRTPTLHLIGTVDTVVGEDRSRDLASKCVEPSILPHAGGHHVPHNKFIVGAVAGFIGKYYEGWETETETEAEAETEAETGTQTEEKVEKETETGTKTPTEGVLIDL